MVVGHEVWEESVDESEQPNVDAVMVVAAVVVLREVVVVETNDAEACYSVMLGSGTESGPRVIPDDVLAAVEAVAELDHTMRHGATISLEDG